MTAIIVALLVVTVNPAQDNQRQNDDKKRAEQLAQKAHEETIHVGQLAIELSAVRTKLLKAKLDLEQLNLAEQILLDKQLARDISPQFRRGVIIVIAAKIERLTKADPKDANPAIQAEKRGLSAQLKSYQESFAAAVDLLRKDQRRVTDLLFEENREEINKEISRLRQSEKRLSAELNQRIKSLAQP